jgi:hypothetical protein
MTTKATRKPLLSSIKDPDARAAALCEYVSERVALTIRFGTDTTFVGDLLAVVSVYGRDSYVAVLAYTDEAGGRDVRAFPHSIWRQVESAASD